MVEGPGATRNGFKAKGAIGKRVMSCQISSSSLLSNRHYVDIKGYVVIEVFTVGKELFLILSGEFGNGSEVKAIRLHFGMNGTLMTSKDGKQPYVAKWRKNEVPSLRLEFTPVGNDSMGSASDFVIEARRTTVSFSVSPTVARNKYLRLASHDVCGPQFLPSEVFQTFNQWKSNENGANVSISDAILNQDKFPGVGNIIKVESLHRAKLDPRMLLCQLTDEQIRSVIRECRDFSMYWLKKSRTPEKMVYNRTRCGTCGRQEIKIQKLGSQSLSRVTFWCQSCQPGHFSRNPSYKLTNPDNDSHLNSSLRINRKLDDNVNTKNLNPSVTQFNNSPKLGCLANHQLDVAIIDLTDDGKDGSAEILVTEEHQTPVDTISKREASTYCNKPPIAPNEYLSQNLSVSEKKLKNRHNCSLVRQEVMFKKPKITSIYENSGNLRIPTNSSVHKHDEISGLSNEKGNLASSNNHTITNPYAQAKKKIVNPYKEVKSVADIADIATTTKQTISGCCPEHGVSAVVLRRVQKLTTPNKFRLFYTCRSSNCSYFVWADSHLPYCNCVPKKKSIVRISKTERSGGKWFLCCANGRDGGGCGYFSWTENKHLDPFGSRLTLLL